MSQILKLYEVVEKTKLSKSSIFAYMNSGAFPKSISLGERSRGWISSDIDDWIDQRVADSRKNA